MLDNSPVCPSNDGQDLAVPGLVMSPMQLEIQRIARRAASEYLTGGLDLTQNLSKIAAEEQLTPAQVQSVCAAANRIVYGELYRQAPANDRVVEFPLADASRVLGTEKTAAVSAPWAPVGMPHYVPGQELFSSDLGMEKTAEDEGDPEESPAARALFARDVATTVYGEMAAAEVRLRDAWALFKTAALCELDAGASVGDLLSALAPYTPGPGLLREAVSSAVEFAEERGVLVKAGSVSLRIPNARNLTVERFRELADRTEGYLAARFAYEEADTTYRQATNCYLDSRRVANAG